MIEDICEEQQVQIYSDGNTVYPFIQPRCTCYATNCLETVMTVNACALMTSVRNLTMNTLIEYSPF